MPLLGFDDALPCRPSRVTIIGTSGSGKSTLARRIAGALDLTYVEMDALYHGPRWTPRATFLTDVDAATSLDGWVCEFQYFSARPLIAERADLVVWLDLPVPLVMARVVRRTVRRRLLRQKLWSGNVEGPLVRLFSDPEHIVRWAWATRHESRRRAQDLVAARPPLPVVRLRTPREVDHWVAGPLTAVSREVRGDGRPGPAR